MPTTATPLTPPTNITIRLPSKYSSSTSTTANTSFTPPPLEWLYRTWSVTHSNLSLWHSARNVRITYKAHPPTASAPPKHRIDDLVEYEARSGTGGVKTVKGLDTAAAPGETGVWQWRGKGWMVLLTSHWEVLGWGERPRPDGSGEVERWVVTWFAATKFTKEGVDIYSDRREGGSEELVADVLAALRGLEARPLAEMCAEGRLVPVEISLPWKES
ncbi:hypothetical protein B0T22DRAFT_263709 [Podospora appendiculata]|uniref:Uncharacterized protein n=1 Tax=Podospora appendiculata TaxID=314037 RepID=A0AAE0X3A1_9PEZI|nr:hypothetical protein B0T22DRAFT_263709 [Podospora appendiculata]